MYFRYSFFDDECEKLSFGDTKLGLQWLFSYSSNLPDENQFNLQNFNKFWRKTVDNFKNVDEIIACVKEWKIKAFKNGEDNIETFIKEYMIPKKIKQN